MRQPNIYMYNCTCTLDQFTTFWVPCHNVLKSVSNLTWNWWNKSSMFVVLFWVRNIMFKRTERFCHRFLAKESELSVKIVTFFSDWIWEQVAAIRHVALVKNWKEIVKIVIRRSFRLRELTFYCKIFWLFSLKAKRSKLTFKKKFLLFRILIQNFQFRSLRVCF